MELEEREKAEKKKRGPKGAGTPKQKVAQVGALTDISQIDGGQSLWTR